MPAVLKVVRRELRRSGQELEAGLQRRSAANDAFCANSKTRILAAQNHRALDMSRALSCLETLLALDSRFDWPLDSLIGSEPPAPVYERVGVQMELEDFKVGKDIQIMSLGIMGRHALAGSFRRVRQIGTFAIEASSTAKQTLGCYHLRYGQDSHTRPRQFVLRPKF